MSTGHDRGASLAFQDMMSLCWRLLFRNRRRYGVVVLAIGAGVWGLVLVLNVGDSIEHKIGDHLTVLGGATIVDVQWSDFDSSHPGEYHMEDVRKLKAIPHVVEVAPIVTAANVEALFGSSTMKVRLAGVDHGFWNTIMAYCERGKLLNELDVHNRRAVCVLGEDVAEALFSGIDPLLQEVQVGGMTIQVVGLLGGIQGDDTRKSIFLPISLARFRISEMYPIREMRLRVDHWNHVEQVRNQVLQVLLSSHPGYSKGISVRYFPERIRRVSNTVAMVKYLAYLGSTVSLVLGGIGVCFLMLSAVRERTREIGLKKAVGATDETIMIQFVTEAVMVTVAGGILGAIGAVATCLVLEAALGLDLDYTYLVLNGTACVIASILVGVGVGMYPASQASHMDPVSALKFE